MGEGRSVRRLAEVGREEGVPSLDTRRRKERMWKFSKFFYNNIIML